MTLFKDMPQSEGRCCLRGKWDLFYVEWFWGAVTLVLEKMERVIKGSKGRGEIRSEIEKVTGMVEDGPTVDSLGGKSIDFSFI